MNDRISREESQGVRRGIIEQESPSRGLLFFRSLLDRLDIKAQLPAEPENRAPRQPTSSCQGIDCLRRQAEIGGGFCGREPAAARLGFHL